MTKFSKDFPVDTVDEAAVEASVAAKRIGEKIRSLRLKRSMGLVQLGQQAGLSASFLSQVETGRVVPTLRNLARIALILRKDLSYFFHQKDEMLFRISRAKSRIHLPMEDKGVPVLISDSMSVLAPDRNVVPCIADFLPAVGPAAFHPQIFAGLELVYVIHGSLTLSTETTTELLASGDSAWIDGDVKRMYRCHGEKPAKALIVTFAILS
jgi:transcriptional regulator with XRE-family HTH domain